MKLLAEKNKPFIIAEIASAHEGSKKLAINIAKKAYKAKADAIKFQIFEASELVASSNSSFSTFKKLEFSHNEWSFIFKALKSIKTKWIAEIFDIKSLHFAHNSNFFHAYKIPATCLDEKEIIDMLIKIKKPIIIGTGGSK